MLLGTQLLGFPARLIFQPGQPVQKIFSPGSPARAFKYNFLARASPG